METKTCPGCGIQLERIEGLVIDHPVNATPECWHLAGDVTGFELGHPWLVGQCRQMTVDAYGAQHAGSPTKPIRVAYSLVGLHLALDLGLSGPEVRDAHSRMGKPDPTWPSFERPQGCATTSVLDVARAGVWSGSPEGHAETVREWAVAVWAWWENSHRDAERLTQMLLAKLAAADSNMWRAG